MVVVQARGRRGERDGLVAAGELAWLGLRWDALAPPAGGPARMGPAIDSR
ncbi:hypothetical protein I551_5927 [Mycobacterium ulcerans str. Harvey]|uniref:Uncharacterized protein n=1 Tax=Mycobacterium ulcerans str. Harvey TaxID=1299332 RepID=A0ABP3A860_MYCUL|nr:hypothetical protein I551_5927 [Mycobacterium ulcerans str. Harvey]